jgi:hypothetical protein
LHQLAMGEPKSKRIKLEEGAATAPAAISLDVLDEMTVGTVKLIVHSLDALQEAYQVRAGVVHGRNGRNERAPRPCLRALRAGTDPPPGSYGPPTTLARMRFRRSCASCSSSSARTGRP